MALTPSYYPRLLKGILVALLFALIYFSYPKLCEIFTRTKVQVSYFGYINLPWKPLERVGRLHPTLNKI
jgi:hypothetical protein